MIVSWPSALPEYSINYSIGYEGGGIDRQTFAAGNVRQTRMYDDGPDQISVSFQLTDNQLAVFRDFVHSKSDGGYFNGYYFAGCEQIEAVVRIVGGKYSVEYVAPNVWNTSFILEPRDRVITLTNLQLLYASLTKYEIDDIEPLLISIDQCVNHNDLVDP